MKKINLMAIAVTMCSAVFFTSCSKENVGIDENANMSSQNARGESGTVVQILPGSFNPRVLEIFAGTTVTWVNYTESVQSVTADDESFDSGDIQPRQSFSMVVTTPGSHQYHSKYDPTMVGFMKVTGIR